jgi:hypothetical protein
MSRKVIAAGAILVLLTTGTAFAQVAPLPDNNNKLTREEQERAAADRAYREASKTIQASKSAVDPWGGVRPGQNGPSQSGQSQTPPLTGKNKQ